MNLLIMSRSKQQSIMLISTCLALSLLGLASEAADEGKSETRSLLDEIRSIERMDEENYNLLEDMDLERKEEVYEVRNWPPDHGLL